GAGVFRLGIRIRDDVESSPADASDRAIAVVGRELERSDASVSGELARATSGSGDRSTERGEGPDGLGERFESAAADELAGIVRRERHGPKLDEGVAVVEARRDRQGEPIGSAIENSEVGDLGVDQSVEIHAEIAAEVLVADGSRG